VLVISAPIPDAMASFQIPESFHLYDSVAATYRVAEASHHVGINEGSVKLPSPACRRALVNVSLGRPATRDLTNTTIDDPTIGRIATVKGFGQASGKLQSKDLRERRSAQLLESVTVAYQCQEWPCNPTPQQSAFGAGGLRTSRILARIRRRSVTVRI
jgi:hypothetical protein